MTIYLTTMTLSDIQDLKQQLHICIKHKNSKIRKNPVKKCKSFNIRVHLTTQDNAKGNRQVFSASQKAKRIWATQIQDGCYSIEQMLPQRRRDLWIQQDGTVWKKGLRICSSSYILRETVEKK